MKARFTYWKESDKQREGNALQTTGHNNQPEVQCKGATGGALVCPKMTAFQNNLRALASNACLKYLSAVWEAWPNSWKTSDR